MTSVTYSNPVEVPASDDFQNGSLQQLAQLSTTQGTLVICWKPLSHEVLIEDMNNHWYIQNNALIRDSLAAIMGCDPFDISIRGLAISETIGKWETANEKMTRDFLECEWSDYAYDHMAISCCVAACSNPRIRAVQLQRLMGIPDCDCDCDCDNDGC
jgi:hypothetical protein